MADESSDSGANSQRQSRLTRPPTTQQAVVRALRESIATGELRPGERLYQGAIAEQMGVSRVPVREALNVLKAAGQLDYSPHRGYWVSSLSRESVEEI
ncbi:MAG: GntR family transcriptional regulator, partial [Acidimicrobiia bacterium]|nr:GntR family transcriptional regulator [Acidimicrobiia bacterium]